MAFKMRGFSGFKKIKDKKEKEIIDNIFFIPDLSDKAYDLDIVKQHIFNRHKRRFKKPNKNYQQNIDRLV